uniref:Pyrin domain-containing protein n=1 Tax=Salarias fasciatus TaxID=181472 RepID=A0A672HN00_SALFA
MSSNSEILVRMLDDLVDEDFGRFQWYLWQDGALEGFRPIPKSKLKKLDRKDTVDEMYQTYSDRTLEVTKTVLEKMNMMGLWEKHFKKPTSEPEAPYGEYRAGPVFHDQDEYRIVPPGAEIRESLDVFPKKQSHSRNELFKRSKMSSDPEILVGMLDHLVDEDFGRFQWYLWQDVALEGFRPIPKSKLKKLDRKDTVDEMYQTYSDRTLEVTKTVLEKMNMKGVWEKHFKKNISEPEARHPHPSPPALQSQSERTFGYNGQKTP